MMFKKLATTVAIGVSALCAAPALSQTPIPLTNGGFEDPNLTPSSSWYGWVNGWTASGSPGTTYNVTAAPTYPNTEGDQYLYVPISGFTNGQGNYQFGFEIYQQTETIQANTHYTVSFDVFPFSGQSNRLLAVVEGTSSFTAFGEVIYRPPWMEEQNTVDLVPGQWQTITLEFNSGDFEAQLGEMMQLRLRGDQVALDNVQFTKQAMTTGPAQTFYVSSSQGNDNNSGLSSSSPWKSFKNLKTQLLGPGDKVLLKSGDVWNEQLHLRGDGTAANPIELASYGTGNLPFIQRSNKLEDKCVVIESPSHWIIRDIEGANAKLGLYLRYYHDYFNQNVTVENVFFSDMDIWDVRTEDTNFEYSFNSAIFVGGKIDQNNQFSNVLNGLTVRNSGFENCTAGFLTGWYFPERYKSRITNLTIDNVYSTRVSAGGLMLNNVDGAYITKFRTFEPCGQNGSFIWGSTGGILSSCNNITLDNCSFADTDRMWPDDTKGDGCGFDIDGENTNITIRNTVFANNEGPGLLFLSTYGATNDNVLIEDCTFYNNGLDAATSFGGNAYEIKASNGTIGSATFRNLGLYRSSGSWGWIYPNNPQNTSLQNIRYNYYQPQPLASWEFNQNGNWENWNNFSSDWSNASVFNGSLRGSSSGFDPHAYSPYSWVPTLDSSPYVKVRMRTNSGNMGVLFFTTETDPVWDINKAVGFSVIPDNQWRVYTIDLRNSPAYKGLATQIRIDPVESSGANFRIDYIRWQ